MVIVLHRGLSCGLLSVSKHSHGDVAHSWRFAYKQSSLKAVTTKCENKMLVRADGVSSCVCVSKELVIGNAEEEKEGGRALMYGCLE